MTPAQQTTAHFWEQKYNSNQKNLIFKQITNIWTRTYSLTMATWMSTRNKALNKQKNNLTVANLELLNMDVY